MAVQVKARRRKTALLALLLLQMRKSPELAKLMLLLLVWGHVRSRPGYSIVESPSFKGTEQQSAPKGKGINVRRPRERFL